MENSTVLHSPENLHPELAQLLERKKLNAKSAAYISALDVDAEQLWVLRFYSENGILPTIRQAREIWETHEIRKLTLKAFRAIMQTSLKRKKIVIDYCDLQPFFEDYKTPDEIKQDILKVLTNWKNNFNK